MSAQAHSATARSPDDVIEPTRFHHAVFKTRRLEEMKGFYALVLGTEDVTTVAFSPQGPFASFVSYDDAHHRLGFFASEGFEGEVSMKGVGLHHLAYEYTSLDDLIHIYKRLKRTGLEPVWFTDHGPAIAMYYHDPDGNLVELFVDNFADEAGGAKRFMATDAKYNDPAHATGEEVDPAKLVAARESGLSHAEIHERAWAGSYRPAVVVGPPGM